MMSETSRQQSSTLFEGMTSIRALVRARDEEISDRRIESFYIDPSRFAAKEKELNYIEKLAREYDVPVEKISTEEFDGMTVGNTHGGVAALCTGRTLPELDKDRIDPAGFYVMIEGIEDPYNFGYAIRSIYASGAAGLVVSPRNWLSAAGVVCRSSAGASEMMKIFVSDAASAVDVFKGCGYKVCAAGIRDSVSAYDADLRYPLFLIVGGEKRGISRAVLDKCDMIVRLDYGRHFNASLSAASAASILSYEVLRQNRTK